MQRPKHVQLVRADLRTDNELALAASESVELSILPLLTLVERRISEDELDELDELSAALPDSADWRQMLDFRVKYWTLLASASRNTILQRQVLWWMRAISELEARFEPRADSVCMAIQSCSYRGLSHVLRRRRGAVEYWLKVIEPVLLAAEQRLACRQ